MSVLKSPCLPHLQRKTPVKFQARKITKFPLPHIATGSSDYHEGIKQKRVALFTQTALGSGLPSQSESRSLLTVFSRGHHRVSFAIQSRIEGSPQKGTSHLLLFPQPSSDKHQKTMLKKVEVTPHPSPPSLLRQRSRRGCSSTSFKTKRNLFQQLSPKRTPRLPIPLWHQETLLISLMPWERHPDTFDATG